MKKMITGVLLLYGMSVCEGRAADKEATMLPELVVTPARMERPWVATPYSVFSRTQEEIEREQMARTTPDIIERLPSVMVQKTSYGQGSPFLRGFTGYRTLFMIDGIRLNNSVFRDGPNQYWNTVDPFSLRDVELMLGPASVLYGSDAIGGTLNALTIDPPVYQNALSAGVRLYYRASSAEQSHIGRLQLSSALNQYLSFIVGATFKDFGDLKGGKDVGEQPHTGYQEKDYDIKANLTLSDHILLSVAHQTVQLDDAWRTHKTMYGIDWEGLSHGSDLRRSYDQHRHLSYASMKLFPEMRLLAQAELKVSYQMQAEDEFLIKGSGARQKQGFDCGTLGLSLSMVTPSDWGAWVYGTEYYRDRVHSYKDAYDKDGTLTKSYLQGPVADDATYDMFAAYAEDTLPLFDQRVDLVLGGRYTYAAADANKVINPLNGEPMTIDDSWNDLNGSIRMLYFLDDDRNVSVFAGLSQAFRAPNLSDMTRYDSARSDEIETPVSDLDPERYLTYELGLKARTAAVDAQWAAYYTRIRDMIIRTPTGQIIDGYHEVTKKNSGDGYIYGVEAAARCQFLKDWSIRAVGSWMQGKVDTYATSLSDKTEDYISRLMPPTAHFALRWQSPDRKWWAEASTDMAAKADKLSEGDKRDTQRIPPGGTPGYIVFGIHAGYNVTDDVSLSAACENIGDIDYRIHGSGVNEPGRNFEIAANVTF
ncbi:MAG: TonB-dependent receptor [Spartobacteria bacterium]|nr:TonB-dependent receptor [Spartobacteria bacterium]